MNIKNQLKIISSLYSKGNFIEIINYVEQNGNQIENDWKILTIIGLAFFNNNDLEKAIFYQNKSIKKELTSHNLHNLGLILGKKGDVQGAINAFNKCLKIGIDQPVYYTNIIDFCLENNFIHNALKVSNDMRNKFPDNPQTFFNLGLTYEKLNKYSESLIFYEKCLKIDNTDMLAMNNLGNVYSSLRKTDLAEKNYKKALNLDKKNSLILFNYISFLIRMGRKEEAEKLIRKGIKINRNFVLFYTALAQTKKFKEKDPDITFMQKVNSEIESDDNSKSELLFALSKAYEDTENYKDSALSLLEANNLKFSSLNYNNESDMNNLEKIRNFYDRDYYKKHKDHGFYSSEAIFIIGMPRCGSSLVEQILSSHSKVTGLGELHNFNSEMLNLGIGKSDIEDLLNVDNSFYKKLGKNYIDSVKKDFTFEKMFVDKALNFDKIGFIKLALPNAKIIHCKRSRNDQILSIFKNKFEKDYHAYSYDPKLLNDYFDAYEELMKHWFRIFGKDIYSLSYEDLIKKPKKMMSQILNFCNLTWEDSCLEFYHNKRYVNTISSVQVKKPFYKSSINKWEKYKPYLTHIFIEE